MTLSSWKRSWLSWPLMVALFGCGAGLVLSSCSKSASATIIGKWQAQDSKETVEFRKDGTVITSQDTTASPPGNTRSLKEETQGKYSFTDASHMNVEINTGDTNQPVISISCEVHIQGDKMDMAVTGPDNKPHQVNFKRLK